MILPGPNDLFGFDISCPLWPNLEGGLGGRAIALRFGDVSARKALLLAFSACVGIRFQNSQVCESKTFFPKQLNFGMPGV